MGIALMRVLVAIAVDVFAPVETGADGIFVLVIETWWLGGGYCPVYSTRLNNIYSQALTLG